jgi:hypothetical protein
MGLTELCRIKNQNWRIKKQELASLVHQGLVETISFHLNKKGKPPEWMFATVDGYRILNLQKPTTRGGTGIKHVLIQKWVQHILDQEGLQSELEVVRNGKSVDVGCDNVAIEICLSTQATECEQAKKNLESWGSVIILCPNRSVLTSVDSRLVAEGVDADKVSAVLPKNFVELIHEKILS